MSTNRESSVPGESIDRDDTRRKAKRQRVVEPRQTTLTSMRPIAVRRGHVAVAKYFPGKAPPKIDGYTTALIHIQANTLGGALSPYQLRDANGYLLENIWQFSKVYACVRAQRTPRHRFRPNDIIWEHSSERHLDIAGDILPAYWAWRRKGMQANDAVRYPNGFHGRREVLFCGTSVQTIPRHLAPNA